MSNRQDMDWLGQGIKEVIEKRIADLVIARVAEAKRAIDAEIPNIVAGTALEVFGMVDIMRDQRQLVIKLKTDNAPKG